MPHMQDLHSSAFFMRDAWVGIDAHSQTLSVAVAGAPEDFIPEPVFVQTLANRDQAIRSVMQRIQQQYGTNLLCVYEAGPCGFALHRFLTQVLGCDCHVIAPNRMPKQPQGKVKVDRLVDALALANLARLGALKVVHVPSVETKGIRNACRSRMAIQRALADAKRQLLMLLHAPDRHYSDARYWTNKHCDWLHKIAFDNAAQMFAFQQLLSLVSYLRTPAKGMDADLASLIENWDQKGKVEALMGRRGNSTLSAFRIVAELGDLRRFTKPTQLAAYIGLVPSEYSSGNKRRLGALTCTGNKHVRTVLIQAAWSYTRRVIPTPFIAKKRADLDPHIVAITERADTRLSRRYRHLIRAGKNNKKAVVAIARKLSHFVWEIGQHTASS